MLQIDGERRSLPLARRELALALAQRLQTPGTHTMVVGEAGIGKTHLIDALLDSVAARRPVLRARLRVEDGSAPYAAIRDLLRSIDRSSVRARSTAGSEVAVDDLGAVFRSTLERMTRSGVVIVVDGWQWIDRESRSLLQQVIEEPHLRRSINLLATRRLDDTAEDLAVLPLFSANDLFPLAALPPTAIVDLVRSSTRSRLSDAAASDISRAARGNPLLALELAVSADGLDPRRKVPRTFSDAMHERARALQPDVRVLLATLAVMGPARAADIAVVCERAFDATTRALTAGVVRQEGENLVVTDPRIATIAAEQLSDDDRKHMHEVLAAAATLPEDQRAEHRDDALDPGVDEMLGLELFALSERARRSDRPETALRLIRRSLNRTARDGQVYWERSVTAAEIAAGLADSELAMHLLHEVDFERIDLALLDRAVPLLALTLARRGGTTAVRLRLLPLSTALEGVAAQAVVLLELAAVGWEGSPADQRVELERITSRLDPSTTPRSSRIAQEWEAILRLDGGDGLDDAALSAIQVAEPATMQFEDSVAVLTASWAYQADDLARSRAGLTAMNRAAVHRGEKFVMVQGLGHLAILELLAGRTDQAESHLQEAIAGSVSLVDTPPSLLAAKGFAAVRRGDGEALQILVDDPMGLSTLRRGLMLSHALLGIHAASSEDWDHALEELIAARRYAEQSGIREPGRRWWVDIELARAFIAVGELGAAEEIGIHLESIATRPGRSHAGGQATRVRGLVASARGDHGIAVDHLRAAVDLLERGGFRPELVRSRLELATALHATGALPASVRQLDLARSEAVRIADPRLDRVLQNATERLEREDGVQALTSSEMRVAVLAASGDTNRRIAEKLFLSPRTVETHLASTYRKLGVRTRTQMGLLLQRGSIGPGSLLA